MKLYPLFADLSGRPVLVVGGGVVGERKAAALLEAGARVTVGALDITPTLHGWVNAGRVRWLRVVAVGVTVGVEDCTHFIVP